MRLGNRYELKQPIASGGMAQVWSATDTVLDREVAAKILHPHLSTDSAFVERFRREAVAAASLSHSSIVSIFDTISENGLEAIVMELIEGRTLRSILDEIGAMPAADVVHFGAQIASALDEAHRAGIVHRDIKPANIMICPDRRVMVTDFGIAKAGSDTDLTQTGTLLGTAKYLAPEQVTGQPIDPRSDLYSLGVVMFEALTGAVPFKANTDAATALARLHQDPPLVRSLRPNVSTELAAIVGRLMARDPSRRYPRARMLREALLNIGSATGHANEPVRPPSVDEMRPVPPLPPGSQEPPGSDNGHRPPGRPAPAVTGPAPPPHPSSGTSPSDRSAPRSLPGETAAAPSETGNFRTGADGRDRFEVVGVDRPHSESTILGSDRLVRSGRSRVLPLVLIAVVVGGLVGAGILLTDMETRMGFGDEVPSNPVEEGGSGLRIVELTSFDPQTDDDDKQEREEITGLAADGDLGTAWTTENYRRGRLGGLKDGVGLLVTLNDTKPLDRVELDTNTNGWVAEIYVGDAFAADGSDWGDPVVTINDGGTRVVRELGGAEGSVVLLWIRDTGTTEDRFRFELAEILVR